MSPTTGPISLNSTEVSANIENFFISDPVGVARHDGMTVHAAGIVNAALSAQDLTDLEDYFDEALGNGGLSTTLTVRNPVTLPDTTVSAGAVQIPLTAHEPVTLPAMTVSSGATQISLLTHNPVTLPAMTASEGTFTNDDLLVHSPVTLPAMTLTPQEVTINLLTHAPVTLPLMSVTGGDTPEPSTAKNPWFRLWLFHDMI